MEGADAPAEAAEKKPRRTRSKAAAETPAESPDTAPEAVVAPPTPAPESPASTPASTSAAVRDVIADAMNEDDDGPDGDDADGDGDGDDGQDGGPGGQNAGGTTGPNGEPRMSRRERFKQRMKERRERQKEQRRNGGGGFQNDAEGDEAGGPPQGGQGQGQSSGGQGQSQGQGGNDWQPRPSFQFPEGFVVPSLTEMKRMPAFKLLDLAERLNQHEGVARMRKQDVIFQLLKVLSRHPNGVAADGVLEILPDGYGFLRGAEASYLAGPDDVYISPSQIRRFNLRTGDYIAGRIRNPKDGERYVALNQLDTINGEPLEASKGKVLFENLTPLFPRERFKLERGNGSSEDITGRVLDLMAPIGKGQRALIVSPPKAGKTMLMQQVATAITTNHPDVHLIVLLVDERPEEVTEMQRTV
ncbi:Rho termination factor N-terminal domain-containing protein, partial [Silanimonas sp.]|uniref:Rho termination factor N-terminal domain-containing protein n=1 Tax=Silanimonas sp. TaxID=1929290 RepID=UPI0037C62400